MSQWSDSVGVGGQAQSFKDSFDSRRQLTPVGRCLAIDDAAWHNQLNLGPGSRRAYECELGHDTFGPLPHSAQTEVFVLAVIRDCRTHTYAIVTYTQGEVFRVGQLDPQLTGLRVYARVADRLVPDAVDLVTHNWVHLVSVTNHRQ